MTIAGDQASVKELRQMLVTMEGLLNADATTLIAGKARVSEVKQEIEAEALEAIRKVKMQEAELLKCVDIWVEKFSTQVNSRRKNTSLVVSQLSAAVEEAQRLSVRDRLSLLAGVKSAAAHIQAASTAFKSTTAEWKQIPSQLVTPSLSGPVQNWNQLTVRERNLSTISSRFCRPQQQHYPHTPSC
jgi:hypothetical protein